MLETTEPTQIQTTDPEFRSRNIKHWTTRLESDLQEGISVGPYMSTVWHITHTTDNIFHDRYIINIDIWAADKLIITSSKFPILDVPLHLGTVQQYTMATSFASIQNIYEEQTKNLPNMQKWSIRHSLWKVHVSPTKMFFDIVWSALGLTHQTRKCNVTKETTAWPVHVVGIFPCHSYTV
jgi:hypothetical protein